LQQLTCTLSVLVLLYYCDGVLIWILEHNIDWLVLSAIFCFRAPSHERRLFPFLFLSLLTREKSECQRATTCLFKKTLLAASWTGVSMCQKAVRVLRGGTLVAYLVFCFLFPRWPKPLWMSKALRFSLHGNCWEGWLFSLDTWDFLGTLFGIGTRDWGCILCVCVHEWAFVLIEHIWGSSVSVLGRAYPCHILGNGDGGFRLGLQIFLLRR
jgi:hypothetical protein